jgi:hypothetical protein
MTGSHTPEPTHPCPICKDEEDFIESLRQMIEKAGSRVIRFNDTNPSKKCRHSV